MHIANGNQNLIFVENSIFNGNVAKEYAGALYVLDTSISISQSEFVGNIGPQSSGVHFMGSNNVLHITNSIIFRNNFEAKFHQTDFASAIYIHSARDVAFINVIFHHNNAGGGIIMEKNTKALVQNCSFHNNSGTLAGAIVALDHPLQLVITNTSFVGNRGLDPAAMRLNNKQTIIQSCYFAENVAFAGRNVIGIGDFVQTDLRFSNTWFVESNDRSRSPWKAVINMHSELPEATVYFWETFYLFRNHKVCHIDQNFLHNNSMPVVLHSYEKTNLTVFFTEFASGRLPLKTWKAEPADNNIKRNVFPECLNVYSVVILFFE